MKEERGRGHCDRQPRPGRRPVHTSRRVPYFAAFSMASAAGESGQTGSGGAAYSACARRSLEKRGGGGDERELRGNATQDPGLADREDRNQPPVTAVPAWRDEQVDRERDRKDERVGEIERHDSPQWRVHESPSGTSAPIML